jgi:hypothetical protein
MEQCPTIGTCLTSCADTVVAVINDAAVAITLIIISLLMILIRFMTMIKTERHNPRAPKPMPMI